MTLSQKYRTQLHATLAPIVGDDAIEALLSEFPATDLDGPATQAFVRAEVATVRTEIAELRADVADRLRQQTVWMSSMIVAGMGVAAAVARLIG